MFSKRPDKYTTGLINLRNDCFANSSIQAYSSLPGLTDYLNTFIVAFKQLEQFLAAHNIPVELVVNTKRTKTSSSANNSKFKNSNAHFDIPLHIALAKIVKKLQETQMSSRTVSVWTFLHTLEKIFNAKISRSQHDAHELTQLINETLEHENLKLRGFYKSIKANLHLFVGEGNLPNPQDYEELEAILAPEFPFNGLVLSQMKCLGCKGVSTPSFSPFLMLTLHAPETTSTDLETLLNENESESIEGYQCLKCRIGHIAANENHLARTLSAPEADYVARIIELSTDQNLCINDDLSEELEEYIKTYNVQGVDISNITSTVSRKTQILKPPKIFGIHLSRSSFNGVDVTRNQCRVSFEDQLNLSIGKEYYEALQKFQAAASMEESVSEGSSENVVVSNVFAKDVNDLEDEDVQREDIDETGPEEEDDDAETTTDNGTATEGDDDDLDDNLSVSSADSVQDSVVTSTTLKTSTIASSSARKPDMLNNAPITEDQTDDLREHFKKFKFNENDDYRYRLKAVIRHQGSHTQGHYECYKRKPLYVKDKDGNIFKLSPEIIDDAVEDVTYDVSKVEEPPKDEAASRKKSEDSDETPVGRFRKFSISRSNSTNRRSSGGSNSSEDGPRASRPPTNGTSSLSDEVKPFDEQEFYGGGFRRKLSTFVGRRPSVFQADPSHANVQEIIQSGLATPSEVLVGELEGSNDYFSPALTNAMEKSISSGPSNVKKTKMKKLPTLIKNPFWRISDAQVAEVSRASVLTETTSVYMLYYERIDRKQIKKR